MDEAARAEPVQVRNLLEIVAYISRQHIFGSVNVQVGEHGDGINIVARNLCQSRHSNTRGHCDQEHTFRTSL
jgi:hypothetical protein